MIGSEAWWLDVLTKLVPVLISIAAGVRLTLQRIDQLSQRIDSMVGRLDEQDKRIDSVVSTANTRIDVLNTRVDWFFLTRGSKDVSGDKD